MEPWFIATQIGHLAVALFFGWCVFLGYRWIRRRSRVLGAIVATTIVARATVGLVMFWSSYLVLPVIPSLQDYGGFWAIAIDATGYHQLAAAAVETGTLFPLDHAVPAPFFVDMLAVWMMAVGISPAAAMLFNLCLYMALAVSVVRAFRPVDDWRIDLPCIVGLGGYSFSPVVMMHATQPLKEELFGLTVAIACLAFLPLRRLIVGAGRAGRLEWMVGGTVMALAVFGTAGIRWYYACILCAALAFVLALFTFWGRTTPLPRYLAGSATVLAAAWIAFYAGAGPNFQQVAPGLWQIADLPSQLLNMTQVARVGFLRSGGTTNIVVPLRDDTETGLKQAALLREQQMAGAAYQQRDSSRVERLERDRLAADSEAATQRAAAIRREAEMAAAARVAAEAERRAAALERARREAAARREAERMAAERAEAARRAAELTAGGGGASPGAAPRPGDEPGVSTTRATPERVEAPPPPPQPVQQAPAPKPDLGDALKAMPTNLQEHLRTIVTGGAILFVPITVVRALLDVQVSGGRGFLSVVDLDTLYLDVTLATVFILLWRRRHLIGDRVPLVVFSLTLSATTALLLGYVVTNFGTLWRMRPLIAIPVWIAVVALSPQREPRPETTLEQTPATTSA